LNRLQLAAGTIGLVAAVLSVTAWQKETPVSASPVNGADLFMRKGCASCHNGPQTTARIGVAPTLEEVPDWAGERKPGLSAADYVRESILNPAAFISPAFQESGPTAMPSLNLTPAEVDTLVAYLLASETVP
jgi:mono/diheme cytochrome c family protein